MKNIANIINFVRGCEPREKDDSYLFSTVKNELELCKKYGFKSTVLLQYDALVDPKYIQLLKEYNELIEIGLWFEVVQPLAEACGIEWHGRFPWDWHNDVGFLVGYMPEERIKIIDEAFRKFKEIFGCYPAVAGSWHIDAFSLDYMYNKYNIIASCNCKEQCLTDGYTIWGGFFNGAYYPSKKNMLCPASTDKNQIDVPVFRMLGADPIYQYDFGIGNTEVGQGVKSLEPVYGNSGADEKWVEWYLKENYNPKNLNLAYTQLGQENSFGWERINNGLSMQFEMLDKKIKSGEIELLTLGEAGEKFKTLYKTTPPQSICIDSDYTSADCKTFWYASRFYRANLMYQNGRIWIRDLFVFDEDFAEKYLTEREPTHNCEYYNLPVMDGYRFSSDKIRAGIYFYKDGKKLKSDGEYQSNSDSVSLGDNIRFSFTENKAEIKCPNDCTMRFEYSDCKYLTYRKVESKKLLMSFNGYDYSLSVSDGTFCEDSTGFFVKPENGKITFVFNKNK